MRRANIPEQRTVHFDGTRSRSEEINVDYGVRSLAIELRSAERRTVTYCKQLRFVRFCVERPIEHPVGGPPPSLTPSQELATIAGLRCRRAEYEGPEQLYVWYCEEVEIDDPTGAVLRLEGVPGLILQTETIPDPGRADVVQRVTVTDLSFAPPPPEVFSEPVGYETVDSVDVARAKDRVLLDAHAAENVTAPEKFVGRWLLDTGHDRIAVEITSDLRFRTTVLTAPPEAADRTSDEKAVVKGDVLVVEEPPNDRHYRLSDDGQMLTQVDRALFSFTRVPR
jgi:hypothetical protein